MLSPLGHTWFLDLDGTLVKHNGYLTEAGDTLLEGAKAFLDQIPTDDLIVIVTARTPEYREATEAFLRDSGIRYDHLIDSAPYGERILVNDAKPSGLQTAIAVSSARDTALKVAVRIDSSL